MLNPAVDWNKQKCELLAAAKGAPYLTPEVLADMLIVHDQHKQEQDSPGISINGARYGNASTCATVFGTPHPTMKVWLKNLEASGLIEPLRGIPDPNPKTGKQGRSDALYNFTEVDKAMRQAGKKFTAPIGS